MLFLHLSFFWPPVTFRKRVSLPESYKKRHFLVHIHNKLSSERDKRLPRVLHVLRLIHSHGKLDLQVLIRAVFGNSHFVPFWLLWAIGSRVENNLQALKTKLKGIMIHKTGFNGEQNRIRWAAFALKVSLAISIHISEDGFLLLFWGTAYYFENRSYILWFLYLLCHCSCGCAEQNCIISSHHLRKDQDKWTCNCPGKSV